MLKRATATYRILRVFIRAHSIAGAWLFPLACSDQMQAHEVFASPHRDRPCNYVALVRTVPADVHEKQIGDSTQDSGLCGFL